MTPLPATSLPTLAKVLAEMRSHLHEGIIPFWNARAIDSIDGGYFTHFDEAGNSEGTPEKYLNTQCRLLWWFSILARRGIDRQAMVQRAAHGFEFLRRHFWDEEFGGWYWKAKSDGSNPDQGKVVYGQAFAIYAISAYHLASGSAEAREMAEKTFALLHLHAADTLRGGFYENLERDWSISSPGFHAGDRKSLDIHMHLMEAFTALVEVNGAAITRRRLLEVTRLICRRMIDPVTGCGKNQFDHDFKPIPAIAIRRTWNAERQGSSVEVPTDTTSYGHNVELSWLMHWAADTAQADVSEFTPYCRRLLDHAVANGVDWDVGGVFRDGTGTGAALVLEKEFWQNAEALVGFIDGYERMGNPRYLDAFLNTWSFARDHFIAPCGEWRVLLDRHGRPLDSHVGNDWKVSYHTGRSLLECTSRLERMLAAGRA